jgi:hypothetical protein
MLVRLTPLRLVLLLALVDTLVAPARAGIKGPGVYRGYVATDRWGQHVFHSGPYHLFMTDEVAEALAQYRGKPIELKVSCMSQPMNPGAGRICGFEQATVKGSDADLELSATLESAKVEQGQGVTVHLSVRNKSDDLVVVPTWPLALVLVTNAPFSNDAIGYKDPDGYGYWKYKERYLEFGWPRDGARPPTVACREIRLRWSPEYMAALGSRIRIHGDHAVTILAGGRFEATEIIGKELLPGEYEVFFCMERDNFGAPAGPMSARLPFDVVPARS